MISNAPTYTDFALALAWPDTTARADEFWYLLLRKLGVIKNLNFKVGHAAVILIDGASGTNRYYDFGRYVTPRGCGRARSEKSDPKLTLRTRCTFSKDKNGHMVPDNLEALIAELESNKEATHGKGVLYFSVTRNYSFQLGEAYADALVLKGSVRYSAFKPGNNNCSRFVQQVLLAGLKPRSTVWKRVNYPETFVASPISNVVDGHPEGELYTVENGRMQTRKMTRLQSLLFFLKQNWGNVTTKGARLLPDDTTPGKTDNPAEPPVHVPADVQWLGGIGEGGWYRLNAELASNVILEKYTENGEPEFKIPVKIPADTSFSPGSPYRLKHDAHALLITVEQNNMEFVFRTADTAEMTNVYKPVKSIETLTYEPQYSKI